MLAAPKKQYQNHLAERTWQTISNMGYFLLVHARLPDTFMYHALTYACHIINVLPVRGLLNEEDTPATPHQLFFGKCPMVSKYRVFGCPTIDHRWVTHNKSNGKQTEHGTRGIFIGFHANQKSYAIYSPGSRQIIISDDVIFDENFTSAIATTWQQHKDSLALKPVNSYVPDITTTLEHMETLQIYSRLPSKRGVTTTLEEIPPTLKKKTMMTHHHYAMLSMTTLMNTMTMNSRHLLLTLQMSQWKMRLPWW